MHVAKLSGHLVVVAFIKLELVLVGKASLPRHIRINIRRHTQTTRSHKHRRHRPLQGQLLHHLFLSRLFVHLVLKLPLLHILITFNGHQVEVSGLLTLFPLVLSYCYELLFDISVSLSRQFRFIMILKVL